MSLNLENAFGIHETALRLRTRRAEVLASNLANADTPNYKARDLDFRSVLKQYGSAQADAGASRLAVTHAGHIPVGGDSVAGAQVQYRIPNQPSVDGNTVDPDTEKAAFMDNAMRYQTTLSFLDGRIKSLTTAIKGA